MLDKSKIIFYCDPERYPLLNRERFCAMVNVSDSPCTAFQDNKIPYFWFPIHETGRWEYSPFYGAAKVFDAYYKPGKPLLVHCHGGVCRSPMVAYAILLSEGMTHEEIVASYYLFKRMDEDFAVNIARGCIPADVIRFLKARKEHPTFSICGLLQKTGSPNIFLSTFKQRNALTPEQK